MNKSKLTPELERKIRDSINDFPTNMSMAAKSIGVPLNSFSRYAKKMGIYNPNPGQSKERREEMMNREWSDCPMTEKRRRILFEQGEKCLTCGIREWNGQDLILELDHIDGNRENNERNNLRFLCPNCHSCTPTYRTGNRVRERIKVKEVDLIEALKKKPTIRQALLSVGLSGDGGNYERAKKLFYKLGNSSI